MTQGVEVPSHIPHGTTPKNGFSQKSATKGSPDPPEGEEEAKEQSAGGGEDFPALCQDKRKEAEPAKANALPTTTKIRQGRHKRRGKVAITQEYVE